MNGSPATAGPKRARLEARVSPEQKALFERAAALQGLSLTDFLVRSAQEAAERTVRDHEVIVLSERDTALLLEALSNPPPPNEALVEAFRRHEALVESRP